MSNLTLTYEEQAMLDGAEGPGVKRAMEIVVALARIYAAVDLVPVAHAQIAGVSYKNLGDAGVQFLSEWADEGAGCACRPPSTRWGWSAGSGGSGASRRTSQPRN